MVLNYKMAGTGQPVIILHGIFGMLDNWQSIAKQLSKSFWVISLDLRNHGRSQHSDIFDYDSMTQDIIEFMTKHHIISSHIIGHSMGGKLAMNVALKYPEKVNKLVVVDISPKEYPAKHELILNSLQELKPNKFETRKEIENELFKKINNIKIVQFLLKNVKRDKNKKFAWKMNLHAIKNNYKNIYKRIDCDYSFEGPVLFIRGESSDYITGEDIELISELFPKFRLHTIANAGHWVHAEQPEKLIQVVSEFLNE